MPRFVSDPTKDTAGFPILPKGDYEVRIGEPKPFYGEGNNGVNHGVAYLLTVEKADDPSLVGSKIYQRCYQHSQGAKDFCKSFIIAAAGYNANEERTFNEAANGADWSYDTDSGEVGEAWRLLSGKTVIVSLSIGKNKQTQADQQNIDGWRPLVPQEA